MSLMKTVLPHVYRMFFPLGSPLMTSEVPRWAGGKDAYTLPAGEEETRVVPTAAGCSEVDNLTWSKAHFELRADCSCLLLQVRTRAPLPMPFVRGAC